MIYRPIISFNFTLTYLTMSIYFHDSSTIITLEWKKTELKLLQKTIDRHLKVKRLVYSLPPSIFFSDFFWMTKVEDVLPRVLMEWKFLCPFNPCIMKEKFDRNFGIRIISTLIISPYLFFIIYTIITSFH